MSIVAGIFDTDVTAARVATRLRELGVAEADLEQFTLSPPGRHHELPLGGDEQADPQASDSHGGAVTGAAIGSAIGAVAGIAATPLVGPAAIAGGLATGAYVGSLAGAMNRTDDTPRTEVPLTRPAGVMLAVNVPASIDLDRVVLAMRDGGAQMIEHAEGEWRDGRWADFDPVRPPAVIEQRPAT